MSKPVVAIVGRPNVGKSTLFNALAGERISIVQDTPGVTRDRIYAEVSWLDHNFTMIDTGDRDRNCRRDHVYCRCQTGLAGFGFQSCRYAAPFRQTGRAGRQ